MTFRPDPRITDEMLARVVEQLNRRFVAGRGFANVGRVRPVWFVYEATDEDSTDSFVPLAGPFETCREAEDAARRHGARLIISAVLERV